MKINILKYVFPALAVVSVSACSDWMTPEPQIHDVSLTEIIRDDAYYEALRAFKASEHSISFGWFSEWDEGDANTSNMLQAVPDSMDVISLWSSFKLTPKKKADLDFVTKVKGTKVVLCTFVGEIGCLFTPDEHSGSIEEQKAYWGWVDGDDEAIHNSIIKWTKVISDSLYINGFSGIDIDYEPGEYGGGLCRNSKYFSWFVEEMGKYIGPKSGTDRLFILDGYLENIPNPSQLGVYFDYFVTQAYTWGSASSDSMLEQRLSKYYAVYSSIYSLEEFTNRFVVTENLESALDCLKGGLIWRDDSGRTLDRNKFPGLMGFASWEPDNGFRKGGFGAFRFSNEKINNPRYKWMRKAIQQQNPAPGYKVVKKEDCVD
ncbi:MAG: glycoside hydrolase family 18 [Clostridium sp.]|nr:glycoside hydrolase family 18 [Clostridium sp.]